MRRISISTMAMPDETGAQAIAKAKLYGYDGIDMRLSPVSGELTEQSTDEEIAALRACAEAAGITIASLMCYNSAVTAENDSDMKMADTVLRALSIADTLGTKLIRIFAGDPNALPEGEHICRTAQVLGSVFARYRGNAQIAIQNHLGSYTAAEAALLCETLGDARLATVEHGKRRLDSVPHFSVRADADLVALLERLIYGSFESREIRSGHQELRYTRR